MKKIVLTTWYVSENYGTCLQCYALAKFLRNNEYSVAIPDSYIHYYGLKHPIETLKNISKKARKKLTHRNLNLLYSQGYKKRLKKNCDFAINDIAITNTQNRRSFEQVINEADVFMTGSDQIWNPHFMTPPLFLAYAPENVKKIAYGSSIGVSAIPPNKMRTYKKFLSKFSYIGVREKTAQQLLEKLLDRSVDVVLDPTFLLDKEQWSMVAEKPDRLNDIGEYALVYFLRQDIPVEEIELFCKKKEIVPVYYLSETGAIPITDGIILDDAGVKEFIWGVQNAITVITDSFHASALSINFEKELFSFKRFPDLSIVSQNSRITDLLEMFNITDRLIQSNDKLNEYIKPIDYGVVSKILEKNRIESRGFLIHGIEE